jgi:hypothetical protein
VLTIGIQTVVLKELYRTVFIDGFSYMRHVKDLIDQRLITGHGVRAIGVESMQHCPDRWTNIPFDEDNNKPWTSFWKNMKHLLRHTPGLTTLQVCNQVPDSFLKSAVVPGCGMSLMSLDCVIHPNGISTLSAINSLVVLQTLKLIFIDPPFSETSALPRITIVNPSVLSFHLEMPEYKPLQAIAIKQAMHFFGRSQFFLGADGRAGCSFVFFLTASMDAILSLNPLFERHLNNSISWLLLALPETSSIFQAADFVELGCVPPARLFEAARLPSKMEINVGDEDEDYPAFMDIVQTLIRSSRPHRLDLIPMIEHSIFCWMPTDDLKANVLFSSGFADMLHPYAARLRELGVEIWDGYEKVWDVNYRVLNVSRIEF